MSDKMIRSSEAWIGHLTKHLVAEILAITKKEAGEDEILEKDLGINFVAAFIGAVVYKTLRERPVHIKTREEMLTHTTKSFAETKLKIQDAVAAGFQGAMQTYTKQSIDYYCQVKTIPPAFNKEPC